MKKLRDIATIQTGVFAKNAATPNALYLQQSDFDDYGVFKNITKPSISVDNVKHFLNEGDLLLASKGNNNICVIVPKTEQKCIASPSFLVIRLHDKNDILPEYITWYMNLPIIQKSLATQSRGTSIMSISKATLSELEIPIPLVEKQKKYIKLFKLQKKEQELYKAIAEKRKQILDCKMLKNI